MGEQLFLETLGAESLSAPPGACITDDFSSFQIIEGDRRRIRLDDQALADQAGRGAVAIAIKMPAQVFVDQDFGRVTIVRSQRRQRPQAVGPETIAGTLPGFPMKAHIGDFIKPLPHLTVDIREINEIHRLARGEHWSMRRIARHLHRAARTVKKYLWTPVPAPVRRLRPSKLDPFKPLITDLLDQDPRVPGVVILQRK